MIRFVIKRLTHLVVVLFCGLTFVFLVSHVIPADPARQAMGQYASEASVANYRQRHGLDRPVAVRFAIYIRNLLRGDLGTSILSDRSVVEELGDGIPATFELVVPALFIASSIGLGLGIMSATRSGRLVDHVGRFVSLFGMSMPIFWFGLALQLIFYRWLNLLPIGQRLSHGVSPPSSITGLYTVDSILAGDLDVFLNAVTHLILPVFVLSLNELAIVARLSRATFLEVLQADYIRTAHSKGLRNRTVLLFHALPNVLNPIVTVIGLRFGAMLGGAVIVETIFAWPGVGRRAIVSLLALDYPVVMGFTLWMVIVYSVANLFVDLSYPLIDPRIRLE